MPKPKFKRKTPSYTMTQLQNDVLEFHAVKEQMKLLKKREDELKGRVGEAMEKLVEQDTAGHRTYALKSVDGKSLYFQRQARQKISLNQERALAFLKERKLDAVAVERRDVIAPDVTSDQLVELLLKTAPAFVVETEVVVEDALAELVQEGHLSAEDVEELCDRNVTYAHTFVDAKYFEQEEE